MFSPLLDSFFPPSVVVSHRGSRSAMAHLAYWPSQHAFFPFGDTSPVNLAELVPQNRDADILLLGCGDPRSIFFTILSCSADDPLSKYTRISVK